MPAAVPLALLAAGALGVHLERTVDLPLEDALAAVHALADAIARRTEVAPGVDDPLWRGCESDDRCIPQIRERLSVDRVILVRAYGSPRGKLRIVCELAESAGSILAKTELDLPKERETWPELLDRAAAELVPAAAARFNSIAFRDAPFAPPLDAETAAHLREPRSIWPWVLLGASTILAGTGAGFGASSASAKTTLEARIHGDRDYDALSGRQETHAIAANVMWIGAAIAAATGATWLILE